MFIAVVNGGIAFALNRRRAENGVLYSALIGLALTFVSITIPIQMDGTFITLLWACEMVIVLWLFIKWRIPVYEYFVAILFFLANVSYWMDIEQILGVGMRPSLFANGMFATGVSVGVAFLLVARASLPREGVIHDCFRVEIFPVQRIDPFGRERSPLCGVYDRVRAECGRLVFVARADAVVYRGSFVCDAFRDEEAFPGGTLS